MYVFHFAVCLDVLRPQMNNVTAHTQSIPLLPYKTAPRNKNQV